MVASRTVSAFSVGCLLLAAEALVPSTSAPAVPATPEVAVGIRRLPRLKAPTVAACRRATHAMSLTTQPNSALFVCAPPLNAAEICCQLVSALSLALAWLVMDLPTG